MVNYLVGMDDTDMPGTKGTGWLVQRMRQLIEDKGLGSCSAISRPKIIEYWPRYRNFPRSWPVVFLSLRLPVRLR